MDRHCHGGADASIAVKGCSATPETSHCNASATGVFGCKTRREVHMQRMSAWHAVRTVGLALLLLAAPAPLFAQGGGAQVAIGPDDIGGVVRGVSGPEAGVWVIAETTD